MRDGPGVYVTIHCSPPIKRLAKHISTATNQTIYDVVEDAMRLLQAQLQLDDPPIREGLRAIAEKAE